MKKKTADILTGILVCAAVLAGCGANQATEAANESIKTEQEGKGDIQDPKEEKEEQEREESMEKPEEQAPVIGIFFPSDFGYERDIQEMSLQLKEGGYDPKVSLEEDRGEGQAAQIQEQIADEVSALIICPWDPYGLSEVLEETKELDIPVIAYDKLIMDTDALRYFVTFDTRKIGREIGESIIKRKDLKKMQEKKESCTIEFLMGSPEDEGALFLYNGIMESLQEYLLDGTLVCRSAQTSFDDTSVMRWSATAAKTDLEAVIQEFYPQEGTPDIICTASDDFALSAADVLESRGLCPEEEGWPIISGVGAQAPAVKRIAEGGISFTVWMDGRELAKECASMVDTLLKGEDLEVDNYEQYDNGIKIIGTCVGEGQLVDCDNYQMLSDSGYYEEEEIQPDAKAVETEDMEKESIEEKNAEEKTDAGSVRTKKVDQSPRPTKIPAKDSSRR